MDTIIVFSVWASNTLKLHFWMTHAPGVGAYEHDFAAISYLFSKRVAYSVLLGVCLVLVLVSIMFSVSLLPFDLVFISLLVVFLFSCVCLINIVNYINLLPYLNPQFSLSLCPFYFMFSCVIHFLNCLPLSLNQDIWTLSFVLICLCTTRLLQKNGPIQKDARAGVN